MEIHCGIVIYIYIYFFFSYSSSSISFFLYFFFFFFLFFVFRLLLTSLYSSFIQGIHNMIQLIASIPFGIYTNIIVFEASLRKGRIFSPLKTNAEMCCAQKTMFNDLEKKKKGKIDLMCDQNPSPHPHPSPPPPCVCLPSTPYSPPYSAPFLISLKWFGNENRNGLKK